MSRPADTHRDRAQGQERGRTAPLQQPKQLPTAPQPKQQPQPHRPVRPTVSTPHKAVNAHKPAQTTPPLAQSPPTPQSPRAQTAHHAHPIERLTPTAKALALEKARHTARRAHKSDKRRARDFKKIGLIVAASIFAVLTAYTVIDTIITNQRVKAETSPPTSAPASDASSSPASVAESEEGSDETKPTASALSTYKVDADLPRALYIDKLGIAARTLPMGVNPSGSVQAPRNIFDSGWYKGSVKPGEIGAMFIDAHASGATRAGLFAYLDTLAVGDKLQVEKGDGSRLTYRVVKTETVKLSDVDMKKVLLPHDNVLRGLNLMTCSGSWVDDKETYDQRVIVWTEQI